jgi:hypothetical protein
LCCLLVLLPYLLLSCTSCATQHRLFILAKQLTLHSLFLTGRSGSQLLLPMMLRMLHNSFPKKKLFVPKTFFLQISDYLSILPAHSSWLQCVPSQRNKAKSEWNVLKMELRTSGPMVTAPAPAFSAIPELFTIPIPVTGICR